MDDERLSADLVPTVVGLLNDRPRRREMAARARALAVPDAAARIAQVVVQVARRTNTAGTVYGVNVEGLKVEG